MSYMCVGEPNVTYESFSQLKYRIIFILYFNYVACFYSLLFTVNGCGVWYSVCVYRGVLTSISINNHHLNGSVRLACLVSIKKNKNRKNVGDVWRRRRRRRIFHALAAMISNLTALPDSCGKLQSELSQPVATTSTVPRVVGSLIERLEHISVPVSISVSFASVMLLIIMTMINPIGYIKNKAEKKPN